MEVFGLGTMNIQADLFPELLHKTDAKNVLDKTMELLYSIREREQHILNALAYTEGTHTFDDIVSMILAGRLTWWQNGQSFAVTEFVSYPRENHIHIFLAGGDLNELLDLQDTIAIYGKHAGCSTLTMAGRKGWLKPLAEVGWTHAHTAMKRNLQLKELSK
jgi:hypothetical protein